MKKKWVWIIVLIMGICPLIAPIVTGIYHMSIESWTLGDWIILYSFIYWPTYIVGLILIILALIKLFKGKSRGGTSEVSRD